MLEALVAATGIGFLLGLRYRVPAVVVASAAAAAAGAVIAHLQGASLWAVLMLPVGAVVALQCGYLGGLLVAFGVSHTRQRRRDSSAPERAPTFEECGEHYSAPSGLAQPVGRPDPARADVSPPCGGGGSEGAGSMERLRRVVA